MRRGMRATAIVTAIASWLVLASGTGAAVTSETEEDVQLDDLPGDGWVRGKLQTLTLREKIGQMFMVDAKGLALTPEFAQHLAAGAFGNIIFFERNLQTEEQARLFMTQLQENAVIRTGVPMLAAVDQEGGHVSRVGTLTNFGLMKHSARTLGKLYDFAPERAKKLLARATGEIAERLKDLGFNMNLAPVLDLTDDKQSFIYDRSYGNDPATVSRITADYVRVMTAHGVITTGKHFPNLSLTHTDSHQRLPVLDRTVAQLLGHELLPFASLKDEVGAVMVGHVLVPAIDPIFPTSVSAKAIKLLRQQIGFKGVIVTDDLKMKAISDRYSVRDMVLLAVDADVDLLLMAWDPAKQLEAVTALETAVREKRLSLERLDRSVRRILELKRRFLRH